MDDPIHAPDRSIARLEVVLMLTLISVAKMWASMVLPNPSRP